MEFSFGPVCADTVMGILVTRNTVNQAVASLPEPTHTPRDFIEVEVVSVNGMPAVVEFQKCLTQQRDGEWRMGWEAVMCWER